LVVEVVDTVIKDIRSVIYIAGAHVFNTKCLMKLFVKTNAKFST